MGFLRFRSSPLVLIFALAILGAGLCVMLVRAESQAVAQQFLGFPDSDVPTHAARPYVLGGMCFLPTLAAIIYALGGALDRYVFRQFFTIFGICFSSLYLIWMLIDLTDKISDFSGSGRFFHTVGIFYGTRLPAALLLLLPYSVLLSLLYSLGRLSAHREIIAMIQAGRGVLRISLPLILAGFLFLLLSLGLNYHWAPIAEGAVDDILAEASGKKSAAASQVLFRNPEKRRLWMIGEFPPNYQNGKPLSDVEVTLTGADQKLVTRLTASRAWWNRENRKWTFDDAVVGYYPPGKPPEFVHPKAPLVIDHWSETPWQLIKPGLSPSELGIPDLTTWLAANEANHGFADPAPYLTHWHYRWAQPFNCLITVLLAAPLGIYFSRRGPGGGVFIAVILSALMLLVGSVVLAFGEAGMMPPALAAWLPNVIFALIGLYLFRRRISGRPIYQSLRKLFSNAA